MISAKLTKIPKRIIIIDPWNYAGVGQKLATALKLKFHVDYIFLNENGKNKKPISKAFLRSVFKSALTEDSLILFVEPGRISYEPKVPFNNYLYPKIHGIARSAKIPFGIFWCGTTCRIVPYSILARISKAHMTYLAKRRDYFNSLTPLRLCATEDLVNIGKGSKFVGQPFPFPETIPNKPSNGHYIIHIPTKENKTNLYKGTYKIKEAFNKLKLKSEIVKFGTSHIDIMKKLKDATIYVMTMTDWPSGTGYTGIEAMASGCLVFSKTPNPKSNTGIIDVRNPDDLVTKITTYDMLPRTFYESERERQFNWAKNTFSNEAVAQNIYNEIKLVVERGWK